MPFRFLPLVLPTLVLAGIDVNIFGEYCENMTSTRISFSGTDSGIITDTERNTFKLSDRNLKNAIYKHMGQEPTCVVLRNPTPWGDIYHLNSWIEVKRILKPRNGKLLKLSYKPEVILQRVFENNSSNPKTFDVGITQEVPNTVSSSWRLEGELSIDKTISHDIKLVFDVIGRNSFSYISCWGKTTEQSQTVVVGAKSPMEFVLQPNSSVVAQLHVTRVNIEIQVEYEASLHGHAVAEHSQFGIVKFNFTQYDIGACMNSAGISNLKTSREVINIEFYVNSKVVVHN